MVLLIGQMITRMAFFSIRPPYLYGMDIRSHMRFIISHFSRQRPYCVECTGSLLNSEVKPRKARIVLGWVTAREVLRVLLAFFIYMLNIKLIYTNCTVDKLYYIYLKY